MTSRAGCGVECPWDREQDERTIVPHTVEEAYELADAANRATTRSCWTSSATCCSRSTSWRCCSRSAVPVTSPRSRATRREKLIRRHPHVFGETEVAERAEVLRNWDAIKATEAGREPGVFGEVPENLPGPLYARKVQRRAASSGFDFEGVEGPLQSVRDELDELIAADDERAALPRARRRAVRGGQRGPQAGPRSGARAARRGRPFSWSRAGRSRSRRIARPKLERSGA